jgi:Asp-tRNA(Asn)/Glu-tRNA(Gln) amidotransferase A subunit family amidase
MFRRSGKSAAPFRIMETSIDDIHAAYRSGRLTAHQLVQRYLDGIAAYAAVKPAEERAKRLSQRCTPRNPPTTMITTTTPMI